jgi:hypothetical protein
VRAQLVRTQAQFGALTLPAVAEPETAVVQPVREKLARTEDVQALVRQVFTSAVDLDPNAAQKTITVRMHRLSSAIHDAALEHLCAELTATETVFPGTDLLLIYELVGSTSIPPDQEA